MKKLVLAALALAILVALVAPPSAEAACYYPRRHVREHIGFYDINGNPNCPVIISPQPTYTDVIGEEIWDCDGSYSYWGIISCAWTITNDYWEQCDPICDDPMASNDATEANDAAQPAAAAASCVMR
ncbi:MAG: hypothetical protein JO197_23835 [Acidobacteria bacterium]|nr:hypothetical protein [Acidobacteriota bacterium]MBV9476939.1 hypothetical protein [Acidobacteriota bacterium]